MASTWVFPKWGQAEEVLWEMRKSLGGYVGEAPNGNIAVEVINPELLVKVPPEYRDRFFKQYYWFRQHIIDEKDLPELQEVYKNNNYDLDAVAKYICDCIPDTSNAWFALIMGVPIDVQIRIETDDTFQNYMDSFMEDEYDELYEE